MLITALPLTHGGGWKKLLNEAVPEQEFKEALKRQTGIGRVHNYYGMAEQTGSIYMECECGHLACRQLFGGNHAQKPGFFSL